MGFSNVIQNKTTGFGSVGSSGTKTGLNSAPGLLQQAEQAGLGQQAKGLLTPPKKLSVLQRLGTGLGAFNPAEAILTGMEKKSVVSGFAKYLKGVGTDIAEAVTGRDLDTTDRRTFKDVAKKAGIENKILKGGLGFVGDVLLDPSTYFGGAIIKGIAKGTSIGVNATLKATGKIAPKVEQGIRLAGQGVREGFGKVFKYGFGTSKGLPEKALEIQSKLAKTKEGIVASNLARLGTDTLSKSQQEELVEKLLAGKRAEFTARNATVEQFQSIGKELSPELDQKILEFSFAKEALLNDPARQLAKFANRNQELPEVLGKGGKFQSSGDEIADELGFQTSEEAREAYQAYLIRKKRVDDLADGIRKDKKYFKDEKALDNLLAIGAAENLKLSSRGLARQTAFEGTSPEVTGVIESQIARSQKFAKQAGIKDPYEIYFPGLKNDSVKNFLEGTKVLKVGSEGYLKQFKNLLTDDELIKNPAEAFAKREFDIAKDNIVRSELNQAIKQYGKPLTAFKSADEALKAGYKVVKEKGLYGKEIGYLKEVDKKFLDDLISPEFTTIDMIAKSTGFDALTSLFKRSVTGLFPAFHVRNFVSGHIQNFETLGIGALNPKMISNGQKMAWKLARNDKSLFKGVFGKQMKAFADRFGTSSSYIADIADVTKGAGNIPGKILSKGSLKETAKTIGLGQQAIPFRAARAIGNFIETQQKSTAYLTALSQGKTINEALDLATRAGFDYRALTGFESKIMRRIIPFYSFTRKNIELQLRTLGENPQRINQIMKLMDSIEGDISQEEKDALPDYAKEGFTIKTGVSKIGEPEIATNFGTPIEAFTGLFGFGDKSIIEKQLSMLNNIIKAPLERAVGKDFFRDRPLSEVVEAGEYSKMPDFVKGFLELREVKSKDFKTGADKTKYTANPYRLHLLRQLPTTRGVSTLYNIYNTDVTPKSRLLYGLTGIKPRPIDLETEKYFKDKKQQDALEDLLLRSGVIKKFENVYLPKEKKGGFGG